MRAPKNSHATAGIVTSDAVRARKKMSIPHFGRPKRRVIIGAAAVLTILIAFSAYKTFHYDTPKIVDNGDGNTYTITDKQYAAAQANQLKTKAPATGAPTQEQIVYYEQLIGAELGAQDYKNVVKDYKHLVTIVNDADLPIDPYIDAAKAYEKLGDSSSALAVLDRAQVAVKNQTTDPERLDSYNQVITFTRQEIQNGS